MSFTETIAALPYGAKQQQAAGLLPPILRASGHLLFVLAATADENETLSDEEMLNELAHAKEHWDAVTLPADSLSTAAIGHLATAAIAIEDTIAEWANWPRDVRLRNLRDLNNRIVGVSAFLDRELIGIRTSDPGYQL